MPLGLPSTYWTLMHLVDSGESCSIEDVYAHIDAGDVIDWLAERSEPWSTQTGLPASLKDEARGVVNDVFERHRNAASPGDFAVQKNGFCLLLAYCINEMQGLLN